MHTLVRKQNYRNIELIDSTEGETVGVVRRDGSVQQIRWLGFINRKDAKRSPGQSVKLAISRVDGADLAPGEYVQGCLTDAGVYAVVDSSVAVISLSLIHI